MSGWLGAIFGVCMLLIFQTAFLRAEVSDLADVCAAQQEERTNG